MYIPSHFEEKRTEVLHDLIRNHPFGTLVTLDSEGLNANHIPFLLDPAATPFGTLRAHVARSNPVWRDFSTDIEPLVIFQGPQSYVTPSWYETKRETGKVVPTYNYMTVHAYGAIRVIDDPAWLYEALEQLTKHFEATRPVPWAVTDAPSEFIEKLLPAIVGIEIPITKLLGKWKVSQNRSDADRAGVANGLREIGDTNANAMANAVEYYLRP